MFLNVIYAIRVECDRGVLKKSLQAETEFVVEIETPQKALTAMVSSAPQLQCDLIDVDRYGRVVMRCFAGKTDLGAALVQAGLALAYRQYSSIYSADEESAKTAKLGMWAGAFTAPWAWRRSR